MKLNELRPNKKKRKVKKRLGKGVGSGLGKTGGKGHKGQRARSGGAKPNWFEGGQQRFTQKVPKSGFVNPFAEDIQIINVGVLDERFEAGSEISREILFAKGFVSNRNIKIKVLGQGEVKKALKVKADYFSKSAAEKIVNAGGQVEIIK